MVRRYSYRHELVLEGDPVSILRRASTARIAIVAAALVVLAVATAVASAALRGSGTAPPDKPLATAVHDAFAAPPPSGVSARIRFTDHLMTAGSLPQGSTSALLTGATGRLWLAGDGRFRLELQSDAGDAQVVGDGKGGVIVYDGSSNTVYRLAADHAAGSDHGARPSHQPPSVADIQSAVRKLASTLTLSGAFGDTVAGQPAYRIEGVPAHSGGLLGRALVAWDAANGVPLRVAIYAQGDSSPALELAVTDISFGSVSAGDVAFTPPSDAKVVDVQAPGQGSDSSNSGEHATVTGVDAVRAAVPFPLAAPDALVGLPRRDVRLISGEKPGALLVYGQGLGAVVVLERAAQPGEKGILPAGLPQVSINGATGSELDTALGTAISFDKGGVSYLVAGSLPPVAAERAAREVAP
jgi:outer membrane lipoprotein-sorting protein